MVFGPDEHYNHDLPINPEKVVDELAKRSGVTFNELTPIS